MTDRLLPDKAIDVLDEVGARVHLKTLMFPRISSISKKIEDIKQEKIKLQKSQRFEEAAALRDTEKRSRKSLTKLKPSGRRKAATNVIQMRRPSLKL